MVVERGNAYCVGVKVDASIFENHLGVTNKTMVNIKGEIPHI